MFRKFTSCNHYPILLPQWLCLANWINKFWGKQHKPPCIELSYTEGWYGLSRGPNIRLSSFSKLLSKWTVSKLLKNIRLVFYVTAFLLVMCHWIRICKEPIKLDLVFNIQCVKRKCPLLLTLLLELRSWSKRQRTIVFSSE